MARWHGGSRILLISAFLCIAEWPRGTLDRLSPHQSRLTRASQGTRTQIWDASPQIRFRLFTGNYSQYTFQCVTPNAADAALALKRTLTNLRLATVPEAYSLFPAEQSCCVCVCELLLHTAHYSSPLISFKSQELGRGGGLLGIHGKASRT